MEDKNIWEEEVKEMKFHVDNEITKNMAGVVLDRVTVSQKINLQKMMESDTEVLNGWNKEGFSVIIWYSKQGD